MKYMHARMLYQEVNKPYRVKKSPKIVLGPVQVIIICIIETLSTFCQFNLYIQ